VSTEAMSPNFTPAVTDTILPTASSPNFGPIPTITAYSDEVITGVAGPAAFRAYQPKIIRRESASETAQEKERQRSYMFMHFGA
jgi:hypothetical protein